MKTTEYSIELGHSIARFRKKKKLSQVQLANSIRHHFPDVRMTEHLVSRLERGTRALAAPEMNALVSVLGVSVEDLLPAQNTAVVDAPVAEEVDMAESDVYETAQSRVDDGPESFITEEQLERILAKTAPQIACHHYCESCRDYVRKGYNPRKEYGEGWQRHEQAYHTGQPSPYCTCCNPGRAKRPETRNTYLLCATCSQGHQEKLSREYQSNFVRAGIEARK